MTRAEFHKDSLGVRVSTSAVRRATRHTTSVEQQVLSMAGNKSRDVLTADLHDRVIQSLYVVALGLAAQERSLTAESAAAGAVLRAARVQIDGLIEQVRDSVRCLMPERPASPSLVVGLEQLVQELRSNALSEPRVEIGAGCDELRDEVRVAVLYVAREATFNALRHAAARCVQIRVSSTHRELVLSVRDNGHGFELTQPERLDSGGLKHMADCARGIGGQLAISSKVGHGTHVRLCVPEPGGATARRLTPRRAKQSALASH